MVEETPLCKKRNLTPCETPGCSENCALCLQLPRIPDGSIDRVLAQCGVHHVGSPGGLSLSRPNDNESTERPDVVAGGALKDLSAAPARGRQAGAR